LGDFYIASINYKELCAVTFADVRRIKKEREVETYLGIQRPLSPNRVKGLAQYVTAVDACFPTGVIVAVEDRCASYDEATKMMTLTEDISEVNPTPYEKIARVLDGQHRIAGLEEGFKGPRFEMNISIFVAMDIAEQANVFATVNLAQTKVNKSLGYDLFDLAKARSPQKTCHNIAVALDSNDKSPFFQRIKRLGVATEGRFNETITQATVVESLMVYISDNPELDRDLFLRGKPPSPIDSDEAQRLILRNMFLKEKDMEIADCIWNLFSAVRKRWPQGWEAKGAGSMLNKTNGFRAFMRFLRPAYLYLTSPGNVPAVDEFMKVLNKITLKDEDFNIENFKPGTSGEASLYRRLLEDSKLEG
jgi:DGQHR domain-containing protein